MRTPLALPLLLCALLLGALVVGAGALAPVAGAVSFAGHVDYQVGASPDSVAVGDFDGDAVQDLAVTDMMSNTVSVLLGNGAGTFATAQSYDAGDAPQSVAVGDFDGDGHQDLAVANGMSDNVSVLLGDGAGSFATAQSYDAGDAPQSVAVGDFDGDGHQDLAVADWDSDSVSVLLGDGAGGFGTATDFGAGTCPDGVAVGDFNGDGCQDLAVANYMSNVSVLLGDGAGGFGTAQSYAAGDGPNGVAVGDFNGDGHQDLAVVNITSETVSILLGDGAGGFAGKADFSTGTGSSPWSVAVGDFNGDGYQDLVTADSGSNDVGVLLGAGAGDFGTATGFSTGIDSSPRNVAVGDFNNDGKQDLATADSGDIVASTYYVSVLLGVREAPSGSMRLSGGAAVTANCAVTVDAGVAEPTQMRVRNAGGEWSEWSTYVHEYPWTLTAGEGEKSVEAEYRNDLGTISLSASILLDTGAPGPVVKIRGFHFGWQKRAQTLRFTATPSEGGAAVASVQYRLNGGAWTTGAKVRIVRQGVTRVSCRAIDALGRAGSARRCTVRLDSRRPRVVARPVTGAAGSVTRLSYEVRDPRPGCGHALVRLVVLDAAGRALTRSSTRPATTSRWHRISIKTSALAPGAYTVVLRARDAAGNFQRGVTRTRLTVK